MFDHFVKLALKGLTTLLAKSSLIDVSQGLKYASIAIRDFGRGCVPFNFPEIYSTDFL